MSIPLENLQTIEDFATTYVTKVTDAVSAVDGTHVVKFQELLDKAFDKAQTDDIKDQIKTISAKINNVFYHFTSDVFLDIGIDPKILFDSLLAGEVNAEYYYIFLFLSKEDLIDKVIGNSLVETWLEKDNNAVQGLINNATEDKLNAPLLGSNLDDAQKESINTWIREFEDYSAFDVDNDVIQPYDNFIKAIHWPFLVEEQVTASEGADPYIFPVDGPPVKLPNAPGRYRMFQDKRTGTYVDVDVDFVPEVQEWMRMMTADDHVFQYNPVTDGYYLTSCTITTVGSDDKWTLDLRDASCFDRTDLPWTNQVQTGVSSSASLELGGIIHGTYQSRTLQFDKHNKLEIRIYDNKQILNALIWTLPPYSKGTVDGLLYKNYRPSIFDSSGKHKKNPFIPVPTKTGRRTLTNKSIVGYKEDTASVLYPTLFTKMFQV